MLQNIRALGNLKDLSIQLWGHSETSTPGLDNFSSFLHVFSNLTSLELCRIYGNGTILVDDIAKALGRCPHLRQLALGMKMSTWGLEVVVRSLGNDKMDILELLCLRYSERENWAPLKLHTLRLGYGMYLRKPRSSDKGNYVAKLTQVSALRCLHVCNGFVYRIATDSSDPLFTPEPLDVCWDLLRDCSLRQLSVTIMEKDVRYYLEHAGQSVEELIITHTYNKFYDTGGPMMFEPERLDLPNLKLLWIDLQPPREVDHTGSIPFGFTEDQEEDMNVLNLNGGLGSGSHCPSTAR
jgi:hypothetical protein